MIKKLLPKEAIKNKTRANVLKKKTKTKTNKQTNKKQKSAINAPGQDYFCKWSALESATQFFWVSVTRRVGIAAAPEVGVCLFQPGKRVSNTPAKKAANTWFSFARSFDLCLTALRCTGLSAALTCV